MIKFLTPIKDKDEYSSKIQKDIEYYIYSLVYANLVDFLKTEMKITVFNAKMSALINALETNQVIYIDGAFRGKFSSSISKELKGLGATFSRATKSYRLPLPKIPMEVRGAIASGTAKLATQQTAISNILKASEVAVAQATFSFDFSQRLDSVFSNLDTQFKKTTAVDIAVTPDFSGGIKEALIEKYNTNMDLSIKGWQNEAVVRLRSKVEANMKLGFRADKLKQIIINEFGATANKAKFLAIQETSLLVSSYREERYASAGVYRYKWSDSGDSRVRQDHKDLNGKIFSFSNPPITNKQTGARNNPGEDYRCRCVPIPIVE